MSPQVNANQPSHWAQDHKLKYLKPWAIKENLKFADDYEFEI